MPFTKECSVNNLRNQVGFADALNLGQQLSSCVGLIAETDVNGVVALVWHGLGVLGGSPLGPMMEVSTQPPAERTDHEIRKHPLPARRRLACQRVWSFHERIGSGRETFRRPACREQHPNLCLGNHAAAFSVPRRTPHATSGRRSSQRTPVSASIRGQYSAGICLAPSRQNKTDCGGTLMPFARRCAFPAASIAISIGFMPTILHM